MLIEIFAQNLNQRPKHLHWLLRIIRKVYADKAAADALLDRSGLPHTSMPDFVYRFLKSKYGTSTLVSRNLGAVIVTAQAFRRSNLEVDMFSRFLEEVWGVSALDRYMEARRLSNELQIGVSYFLPAQRSLGKEYICLLRAQAIARAVLGERSPEARAPFWARIAGRSLDPEPEELAVTDSSVFQAHNRDVDESHTWKKMLLHEFLFMLVEEYILVTNAFRKTVPDVFHAFAQHRANPIPGTVAQDQFGDLLDALGVRAAVVAVGLESAWQDALLHSETAASGLVDVKGFRAMCHAMDDVRSAFFYIHVPVYRNVHAELVNRKAQSALVRVIQKHWRFYNVLFEEYCPQLKFHARTRSGYTTLRDLRSLLVKALESPELDGSRVTLLFRKILYVSVGQLLELRQTLTATDENPVRIDRELDFMENMVLDLVKWGNAVGWRARHTDPSQPAPTHPSDPSSSTLSRAESVGNVGIERLELELKRRAQARLGGGGAPSASAGVEDEGGLIDASFSSIGAIDDILSGSP